MIRFQRGITLIEVLVTLAILSLLGTMVWGVFFQGNKASQKIITKNMIQQEANLVIANLLKIHQTSTLYTISNSDCTITVTYTKSDNIERTQVFDKTGLCYSTDKTGNFEPTRDDSEVNLKLSIYDQTDSQNRVDMNVFLYRFK